MVNYFCKKLYLRCLTGFWIRLWKSYWLYQSLQKWYSKWRKISGRTKIGWQNQIIMKKEEVNFVQFSKTAKNQLLVKGCLFYNQIWQCFIVPPIGVLDSSLYPNVGSKPINIQFMGMYTLRKSCDQVKKYRDNYMAIIGWLKVSLLTHLFLKHPFSTPWKHQKTLRFFNVFRE